MSLKVIDTLPLNIKVAHALPGYRHLGFPAGGASDERLWGIAEALIGKPVEGVLEIRGPIKLQFQKSCVIGVSTWSSIYDWEGRAQKGHTRISGEVGQILSFNQVSGMAVLAGVTFNLRTGTQKLSVGEEFECEVKSNRPGAWRLAAEFALTTNRLRWIPVVEPLFLQGQVEAASRIGVRIAAERSGRLASAASEASMFGVVQETPDGTILIHGVDGPTIGGYEKIGAVIRADLWELGSLMGGERVELVPVTLDEARQAWQEEIEWRTRTQEHIRQVLKNLTPND